METVRNAVDLGEGKAMIKGLTREFNVMEQIVTEDLGVYEETLRQGLEELDIKKRFQSVINKLKEKPKNAVIIFLDETPPPLRFRQSSILTMRVGTSSDG